MAGGRFDDYGRGDARAARTGEPPSAHVGGDALTSAPDAHPRMLAVMPAFNEGAAIANVIAELREFQPAFDIAVVDDGSRDDTAVVARNAGAHVLSLPFNLGIGGAVQTGFVYAAQAGYDIVVQVDGDGQHDPREMDAILTPLHADAADVVIGSRFLDGGTFRHAAHRRFLIGVFARLVTLVTGRRFTDTSSSFRAYNRRAITICADDYPQGFLESVESTVTLSHYGLRMLEVPVTIRQRETGATTLSLGRTMVYTVKVAIAIGIGALRQTTDRRP